MNFKIFSIPLITLSLFLNSCGSSSSSSNKTATFEIENKTFLHELFLSEYLWYDQVASNVDYTQYSSPHMMINTLRIMPPDQWSFALTAQEYEDFENQNTSGFGIGYTQDLTIFLVRIDAPAYGKLFRGDKILEVNSKAATQVLITQTSENVGHETVFTVLRGAQEVQVSVTPRAYSYKVSLGKIIPQGSKNIAYLRYDAFTESSVSEFEAIFSTFKSANVNELVIDMRYNGGGSISTASALLDNISNVNAGKRQVYLDWNANYKHNNTNYYFEDADMQDGNELNMKRVIFLVTYNSASSSELIISALRPYLGSTNVVTVGSATHGKPVGMSGRIDGEFYYFLVNFYVRNNAAETTSFYGIPATCTAEDDLSHIMGDVNEEMLSTALYYITHNVCP
ncbi:S41 family peptidase [Sulfurovum sp.]|uniref:S41 family peptidase n=1 Tax=Sulfurovum sp. TaxID=1969726 RepID=UPI002868219B|nr:S41 family peptidase [Sulfurovum sp.]